MESFFQTLAANFTWAKLLYSCVLLGIGAVLVVELKRLWVDERIYIGSFEFFEAGANNDASAKSFARQLGHQHKTLKHFLAREAQRRTATGPEAQPSGARAAAEESTWWPTDVATIKDPQSVLAEAEFKVQGFDVGAVLKSLRRWVAPSNTITGTVDKAPTGVLRVEASWPKGPSPTTGDLVDAQLLHVEGRSDAGDAAFHLGCSIVWGQAAGRQGGLAGVARLDFCDWADAWMKYLALRDKAATLKGLEAADLKTLKDVRKFLDGRIEAGNSYPEMRRLRADVIDLLPVAEKTKEDLAQAQHDRTVYAIRIAGGTADDLAIQEALAKARPAWKVENGRVAEEAFSPTWRKVAAPYGDTLAKAAGATGFGRIVRDGAELDFVGFVVGENLVLTTGHSLQTATADEGGDLEAMPADPAELGRFSFGERREFESGGGWLQIEEVVYQRYDPDGGIDLALLRTSGHDVAANPPLEIETGPGSVDYISGRYAFVCSFPQMDSRLPETFNRLLIQSEPGVKRIMPGRIQSLEPTDEQLAPADDPRPRLAISDASTTARTSGGPLVDFETGRVIGLHVRGEWRRPAGKFAKAQIFADVLRMPGLPEEVRTALAGAPVADGE